MSDPIALLERLSARAGAGRAPSAELTAEVLDWVTRAAPLILAGEPPAKALNLSGRRGSWQGSPLYRLRFSRRNEALRELWNLTAGSDADRNRTVQGWVDDWRAFNGCRMTGAEVRRLFASIPDEALPHLDDIVNCGLSVPVNLRGPRVLRPASPGTPDNGPSVSVESEVPLLGGQELVK